MKVALLALVLLGCGRRGPPPEPPFTVVDRGRLSRDCDAVVPCTCAREHGRSP